MKRILIITNGHGEDRVGRELVKYLPGFDLSVMPLVGKGEIFQGIQGIKVIEVARDMPSGGFGLRNFLSFRNWISFFKDLRSGLLSTTRQQIKLLRSFKGEFDLAVAIGDYTVIYAAQLTKVPFIFIGVNKSDYYRWFGFTYTPWELRALKKHALMTYARDKITAENLKLKDIKAEYVGNPLMDCFNVMRNAVPAGRQAERVMRNYKMVGILPGTREDAKLNLEDIIKVAEKIKEMKNGSEEIRFVAATNLPLPQEIEKKDFGELLAVSDIVIGLSGTGNEQAAFMQIPVISFYGRGSQYTKRFARAQKHLLGEALSLIDDRDPIQVAAQTLELLRDDKKREEMGLSGKERMGERGALPKIAEKIKNILK